MTAFRYQPALHPISTGRSIRSRRARLWMVLALTGAAVSSTLLFVPHSHARLAPAAQALARPRSSASTDQARRDRDAGEPLVRLLLRDVRARTGFPGAASASPSASPTRSGACELPHHDACADRNFGGPHGCADAASRRHDGPDERLHPSPARSRHGCYKRPTLPICSPRASITWIGYHDWHEIPNYWVRAPLHAAGPHVRAGQVRGVCLSTFMVSEWSAPLPARQTPDGLRERAREPARPAARAAEPD